MISAEVGHLVVHSLALGAFVIALGCAPTQEPADLVLRDGKIMTVEEAMPEAEDAGRQGRRNYRRREQRRDRRLRPGRRLT